MELLEYSVLFISSIFFTVATVPLVNSAGIKLNIFDKPENRKQHKNAIVRLGGISIMLGFLVSLSLLDIFSKSSIIIENRVIIFLITCFFLLGLVDDIKRISPWTRLVIEILLASLSWINNYGIYAFDFSFSSTPQFYYKLPVFLSFFITLVWIVGTTNAINWMDGLDGLASGLIIIAAFGMILVSNKFGNLDEIYFLVILCGVCLGFLKYNFYPSKILMGDCGSYLLGFCIALFTVSGSTRDIDSIQNLSSTSILIPALVLFIPLFDMTRVIVSRILKSKSPFFPDRNHLHYLLIDRGLNHKNTVITIHIFSFISLLLLALII